MASDYDLVMGQDQECKFLCSRETDRKGIKRAQKLVGDGYVVEWIADNLPGATSFVTVDKSHKYYAAGFKLGYKDFSKAIGAPRYFINNHVTLVIRWRTASGRAGANGGKSIVGFEVYTKSIEAGHRDGMGCPQDIHGESDGFELYIAPNATFLETKYPDSSYLPEEDDVDDGSTLSIPYSYSVYFREEERIEWSKRWDLYFNNQEEGSSIHWLAIVNSLVISGLLTAVVVVILNRTVFGDVKGNIQDGGAKERIIRRKSPRKGEKGPSGLLEREDDGQVDLNSSSDDEFVEDITGWKLLHGDVFRPPRHAGLLAPLIGSGTQLVFMTTGLLVLSSLGVLNPSFRGGFVSVGMGLFVFAGVFSGYFSTRVYKTLGGLNWRNNIFMVSCFTCAPECFSHSDIDRIDFPWRPFHRDIHPQPLRLGAGFQHCSSVWHSSWTHRPLALDPGTPRLCRGLVRLP